MVVAGPLLKIQLVYVVVEDQKYEDDSCLSGLDLAFRIFYALDCEYPKASYLLWQFIQRAGYSIKVNGEKLGQPVNGLLGLVEHPLPEVSKYTF